MKLLNLPLGVNDGMAKRSDNDRPLNASGHANMVIFEMGETSSAVALSTVELHRGETECVVDALETM